MNLREIMLVLITRQESEAATNIRLDDIFPHIILHDHFRDIDIFKHRLVKNNTRLLGLVQPLLLLFTRPHDVLSLNAIFLCS